jgi:hypothetical protein
MSQSLVQRLSVFSPAAGFLVDTTSFHSSTDCGMSVEKEERDITRIEKGKHKKRNRGRSNIKTGSFTLSAGWNG